MGTLKKTQHLYWGQRQEVLSHCSLQTGPTPSAFSSSHHLAQRQSKGEAFRRYNVWELLALLCRQPETSTVPHRIYCLNRFCSQSRAHKNVHGPNGIKQPLDFWDLYHANLIRIFAAIESCVVCFLYCHSLCVSCVHVPFCVWTHVGSCGGKGSTLRLPQSLYLSETKFLTELRAHGFCKTR